MVLAVFLAVTALPRRPVLAQTGAEPWHPFEEAWNWVALVWRGPVMLRGDPGAKLNVEQVKGPGEAQPIATPGKLERWSDLRRDCRMRPFFDRRRLR